MLKQPGGTALVFAASGAFQASWMSRLPAFQDQVDAGVADLGMALALLGAGTVIGMFGTGRIFHRVGTRQVVLYASTASSAMLVAIAVAPSPVPFTVATFVLGMTTGSLDTAMNVHAIAVEKRYERHLMTRFHGMWSVGSVVGASSSIFFASRGELSILVQCVVWAAMTIALCQLGGRSFDRRDDTPKTLVAPVSLSPRLATLATIILLGAIIEGAANDWLTILLADVHDMPHMSAAIGYTVFVGAMAVGRLGAHRLHRWISNGRLSNPAWRSMLRRDRAVQVGVAVSMVGVWTTVFGPVGFGLYVGIACWALGICILFPAVLSAAGSERGAGAAVAVLSTVGYGAGMLGPLTFGVPSVVGRSASTLGYGLAVVLPLLGLAVVGLARWIRTPAVVPSAS